MNIFKYNYSDFYIEEEKQLNPCGDYLKSEFYIKHAYYNLFGIKKYVVYKEGRYHDYEFLYYDIPCFDTVDKALAYWKTKSFNTQKIKHKIDCNE